MSSSLKVKDKPGAMEANTHQIQTITDDEACDRPSPLFKPDNARKWFDRWFAANDQNKLQLTPQERITDLRRCVYTHIQYLEKQRAIFEPYNRRLRLIRKQLES